MERSIDVIVPVYNKAQYLPRCIDMLLKEAGEGGTLIFVDDGSTDGSAEILDAAEKAHQNVIVRHTENRGVSAARNLGLSLSTGRWFTFCDADDLLLEGALEALQNAAEASGADLVSGLIEIETQNGGSFCVPGPDVLLNEREAILETGLNRSFGACYAKLYDRSIFGGLRFDEDLRVNEDGLYVLRALLTAPALRRLSVPVYRYRYAEGSASRSAFSGKFGDILLAGERKKQLAEAAGYPRLGAAFEARHRLMYLNKMASCASGYTGEELEKARKNVLESAPSLIVEGKKEWIRLMLIRCCFSLYVKIMQR